MSSANVTRKISTTRLSEGTPVVDRHGVTRFVVRDAKSGSYTTPASTRSLKLGGQKYAEVLQRLADK